MRDKAPNRAAERGGAGIKFLITLSCIIVIGNAGYHYVPIAYEAESLKSDMQTAVVQGLASPGKVNPVENVKARIQRSIVQNSVPADALVEVKQAGAAVTAHVSYAKPISVLPFGMYTYNYQFDHTATPTGFLLKQ